MFTHRLFVLASLLSICLTSLPVPFAASHTKVNDTMQVNLAYALEPHDALYKNSIRFSVDNPDIEIIDWQSSTPAKTVYDARHTSDALGYTDNGTLSVNLKAKKEMGEDATLFMHFMQKSVNHPQEFAYLIALQESVATKTNMQQAKSIATKKDAPIENSETQGFLHNFITWITQKIIGLKMAVSGLVEKTDSTPLRLVFVFLLGILMSLTPCIYPMIPITVGILQTTAGSSLGRNFLLASCYTLGIAITFATLGLLAATGSAHFGALMGNPYFILFLVAFLTYLALSMLGFYDMYVPSFMQTNSEHKVNGSYLSAFFFGIISGSVASPCLSPGLVLLLSIVATLGNMFLGFIYLFFFGLGLGTPLLIIGTFSNSMNLAPRAGLWMVEVKKLFGLLLLSMCFYYLNAIMPWYMLLIVMGSTLLVLGMWYIATIESYYGKGMRWFKQLMGLVLIVSALLMFYQATKAIMSPEVMTLPELQINTNYKQARAQAQAEQKLLLVDFGAKWCSSCNEIEHKFLSNNMVLRALDNVIIVKVDCTNPHAKSCAQVQEQYNIIGFPTMLLVEPAQETIIARWGGELLDLLPEHFIDLVQSKAA